MKSDRTATETTKHDKTKAKSQKSTPEKRNATARTRSYPTIIIIIIVKPVASCIRGFNRVFLLVLLALFMCPRNMLL